jgi:integrase/recombinase XerD
MERTQRVKELSRDKFLTPDECARLCSVPKLSTTKGVRDYAILKVFLNCGLRKMELLNLKVKDFQHQGGDYWFVVHSKGGSIDEQDVISYKVIEAVNKYLNRSGHANDLEAPLFQPIKGRSKRADHSLSRRCIDELVKKCARKAGISKSVHCHTLRHTFGTELLTLTGDIKVVQKAMRHSALTSTMIYLHTDRERVKRGLAQMNL